jgi:hypothetical protein
MKTMKAVLGTFGVLFSIQPLVSWAAEGDAQPVSAEPIVIQADGNRPIIIESVDGQSAVEIVPQSAGKPTVTIKSGSETEKVGNPTSTGGA